MMANIYGVVAGHAAHHKGYSDFVQHTGTVMSGQLRLVLNESEAFRVSSSAAQTLPVTFGYSQTSSVRLTYRPRFDRPKLERLANPLMGLDYRGSREMAKSLISSKSCTAVSRYNLLNVSGNATGVCRETKHGGSPSSEAPAKNVATYTPGIQWDGKHSFPVNQQITGKEKGRTANATLWDDCFFNHEENQHSSVLSDGRKPNLAYEQYQHLAVTQNNLPSLRGDVACLPADNIGTQNHTEIIGEPNQLSLSESVNSPSLSDLVHRLQPSFGQPQNYTGISGEVQPLRLGVLQKPRKTYSGAHYESFVGQFSGASLDFLRCSALSLRPQASSTQVEKFTLEPLSFSCSTLASISAVSSCGKRIPLYMVLLFMWFFAMLNLIECLNKGKITVKNEAMKLFKQNALTCLNTLSNLFKQSDSIRMKIAKPSSVSSTDRASNHNVNEAYTMACQHSTQTRPKFVFLFLGTPNEFPNTTPTVLRVEADTEDEGRAKFVGWTLIFAAQIRTEAPCRLQLFSTDEGFMWVYEQRQTVKESSHA